MRWRAAMRGGATVVAEAAGGALWQDEVQRYSFARGTDGHKVGPRRRQQLLSVRSCRT